MTPVRKKSSNVAKKSSKNETFLLMNETTKDIVTNVLGMFLLVLGMVGLLAYESLYALIPFLAVGLYVLGYSVTPENKILGVRKGRPKKNA